MIIYQYNSNCIKELLPDYISLDFSSCNPGNYLNSKFIIVLFLVPRENKYSQTYYLLYKTDNLNAPTTVCNNDITQFADVMAMIRNAPIITTGYLPFFM